MSASCVPGKSPIFGVLEELGQIVESQRKDPFVSHVH